MHIEGTSPQVIALLGALISAQAEFPSIPKTKNAYNYKYAPLPEIHVIIRPILAKYGLAVIHPISRVDGKQSIGTTLIHKDGAHMSCDGLAIPEGAKPQEQGGFVTYGSRYGYCSMLGITSEDDDDAAVASGKGPRQKSPRRDGVAQVGRAPLPSGDSGSIPDPSLPTKEERAKYAKQLSYYAQFVDVQDLQGYVLGQSGASEARLVKRDQWETILAALDNAYNTPSLSASGIEGADGLKKLIGGTA